MVVFKKNKRDTNITFVIFTYNEEERIAYPIKCFKPYGQVIIFDNYSKDKTRQIAKSLGAKVELHRRKGFVENKKDADFIFKFIKTDWVFWGMADEMIPKICLELYKRISRDSLYKVVVQKRKTLLFDSKSEFVPCDWSIKFFRKDAIDFSNNKMHEMGRFSSHVKPSEATYLPPLDEYSVYHFSRYTTNSAVDNFNLYSTTHAKFISKRFLGIRLVVNPLVEFLTHFIIEGGFKYGIKGFIISMQYTFYSFLVLAKAYEFKNNINIQTMEEEFAEGKKTLLKEAIHSSLPQKILAYLKVAVTSRLHKFYKFKIQKKI